MPSQNFIQKFHITKADIPLKIKEINNDFYVVVRGVDSNKYVGEILRLNSKGELIDYRIIIEDEDLIFNQIFPLANGNLLVIGQQPDNFLFCEMDTALNILSTHKKNLYQTENEIYDWSIPEMDKDSNLIFTGVHHFGNSPGYPWELLLYKLNLDCDSLNLKTFSITTSTHNIIYSNSLVIDPYTQNYFVFFNNLVTNNLACRIDTNFTLDTIYNFSDQSGLKYLNLETYATFLQNNSFVASLSLDYHNSFKHTLIMFDTNFNEKKRLDIDMYQNQSTHNISFSIANKAGYIYTIDKFAITKLDTNLNIIGVYEIENPNKEFREIITTKDTSALIIGYQIYSNYNEIFVLKTDSINNVAKMFETKSKINDRNFIISPNPASNFIEIISNNTVNNAKFYLFDSNGRTVLEQDIKDYANISVQNLPEGIYMYRIISDNLEAGKIIITH